MKTNEHIYPRLEDWPINLYYIQRKEHNVSILQEINQEYHELAENELDQTIAKAIYAERLRVKNNAWKADPPNQSLFFKKLQKEYNDNQKSDIKHQKNVETSARLVKRYLEEIAGNFNPNTFLLARKLCNLIFYTLLSKANIFTWFKQRKMLAANEKNIHVFGPIDQIKSYFGKHTVVLLPTHSSNLDSMLIGFSIDIKTGMPAFSYGAGLNLFDSEFFAFFMNRLGAYRVDRRKKNSIYLKALTTFSKHTIKFGLNTIFFPGGTRSRSGEVETKLKMGLLGSLIQAQRELLAEGSEQKVIVVPVVLNYESVLEAKSLMLQHLKSAGQEKFTAREKAPGFLSYISYFRKVWKNENKIYITFGQPSDVFGNAVDANVRSINQIHKQVDLKDYFFSNGQLVKDDQRESIYTKELSNYVVDQYKLNNYLLPSHILAYSVFRILAKQNHGQDVFALVQIPEEEEFFQIRHVKMAIQNVLDVLEIKHKEGKLIYFEQLKLTPDQIIEKGLQSLGVYHLERPLVKLDDNLLVSKDFVLLAYYANKLNNLEVDLSLPLNHIHLD
ncbi:MAG TPA: 1-acyl-sn-glycerol-3-phosphate acyltransferase [Saprospiraceae bacterium]|nr:1-acyl-sn-glycerol-3-phosphate acyltransferase [Saprospiraceae bacterium]